VLVSRNNIATDHHYGSVDLTV